MPVLDLARELGPELEPELEPEPGPEPEPAPGCGVAAGRTFVVVLVPALPLFDVQSHRLSDFDLEFVQPVSPRKTACCAVNKLVDPEGMRDGVAGFGVGAEAALVEAGQQAARADVENCWAQYCQRLPLRAKRAKAQHGETKLPH